MLRGHQCFLEQRLNTKSVFKKCKEKDVKICILHHKSSYLQLPWPSIFSSDTFHCGRTSNKVNGSLHYLGISQHSHQKVLLYFIFSFPSRFCQIYPSFNQQDCQSLNGIYVNTDHPINIVNSIHHFAILGSIYVSMCKST